MFVNILLLGFIFIIVDSIFLYLMKNNFQKMIMSVQKSDLKLKIIPTIICYIILISSIYYFIIYKNNNLLDAFLLGFFIYGVFETTNMAIFKKWDYKVGIIDMIWGGVLFLITTYLYLYIKKLNFY